MLICHQALPRRRCDQESADHKRGAKRQKGREVPQNHVPQHRRPVEGEKCPDAAEPEGCDNDDPKPQSRRCHSQALTDCLDRQTHDPTPEVRRRSADQPLCTQADRQEHSEKNQNLDWAAVPQISGENASGSIELRRQEGQGHDKRREMGADRVDPSTPEFQQ